jgi:hypothetical protein
VTDGTRRGIGAERASQAKQSQLVEPATNSLALVTHRKSAANLCRELAEPENKVRDAEIRLVVGTGGSLARQTIADNGFDGHGLGREINAGSTSAALPYIRRHRFFEHSDADCGGVPSGSPNTVGLIP